MREVEFASRVTSLSLEAGQRFCRDTRAGTSRATVTTPRRNGDGYWDSEMVQCDERLRLHPTDGRRDRRFRSLSVVERAGMRDLNEGQKISYDIVADRRTGKSSADNLKPA
jgi:CspA family cold shock protein